jgi:MFS family permease
VILTAAVMGLALIATAFSHNLVEVALCFVVLGLGGGMAIPLAFEMVIRRASVSFRGTAVGIQLSIVGIGQFLNPVFCEPINRQFGIKGGFIGAGCLVLALAIGLISGNFGTAEPGALSAVKDFDATEDFKHLI